MSKGRPNWTEYHIGIAYTVARRATCPVRKVGAVFVNPDTNSVLTVGYNGAPRGTAHCGSICATRKHGENSELCRAVHAEANAIFNAALNGTRLKYSHAYLTLSPCENCAKALIQVGVERVVYAEQSAYPEGLKWLNDARIEAYQYTLTPWWDSNEEIELIPTT